MGMEEECTHIAVKLHQLGERYAWVQLPQLVQSGEMEMFSALVRDLCYETALLEGHKVGW